MPQEAQAGPNQGHHEDADFSRAGVEGNIQGISRQPASAEDGNDGVSDARGDGAAGGKAVQAVRQVHRIGGGHDHHDAERNVNEPWQVHLAIEWDEQGGYVVVKFHAGTAFRVQVQEGDAGQAGQELDEEFFTCGNAVRGFFRHLQVIVPESQQAQRQGDDQAGNDKGIAHSGAQQGSRRHGTHDQHAAHGGRSRLGSAEFRQLVHFLRRPDGLADFQGNQLPDDPRGEDHRQGKGNQAGQEGSPCRSCKCP